MIEKTGYDLNVADTSYRETKEKLRMDGEKNQEREERGLTFRSECEIYNRTVRTERAL